MTLPAIFDAFNRLKVLIIGDIMVDAYVWGKVERISPEAPVPVVVAQRREIRLGGAGNVIMNVQALGAEALVCSVIGNDAFGTQLLNLLQSKGLNTEGIVQSAERVTTVKERIIAGSQQIVRVDTETDSPIAPAERQALLANIEALLPQCDVVIFQDYDKGVLGADLIANVIALAKRLGIPTVVDPKKRNFLHYQYVTLFKPNLKELKEGLNISFNPKNLTELDAAAKQLKAHLHLEGTLITLSEQGVFIDFQEQQWLLPAHIRQIADVSGAGDTVISVAACCVALGLEAKRIAGLSNLAGGLVCESLGVVPIDKNRLLHEAQNEGL